MFYALITLKTCSTKMFTESSNLISHTCTIFKVSKNSVCKHSHVGIVVGCQISQHNFLQSDLHLPDNEKRPFLPWGHILKSRTATTKNHAPIQFAFASLSIIFFFENVRINVGGIIFFHNSNTFQDQDFVTKVSIYS